MDVPLIVLLVILLLLSAFFSATEAALQIITSNPLRLKTMAEPDTENLSECENPKIAKRARKVLKLVDRFEKVLSGILIGNNLVNIAAASIATILCTKWWGDWGPTLSTVILTVLVLLFGEITPKNLARKKPEKFAMSMLPLIDLFLVLFYPLILLISPITKLGSNTTETEEDLPETEEELITFIDEAEEEGELDPDQSELIRSAVNFDTAVVLDIMTSRVNMEAIDDEMTVKDIQGVFLNTGYSRLPVYHETEDNMIGILHEKDFMRLLLSGSSDYKAILQPIVYVPEQMKLSNLLDKLKRKKSHMALVADETGGIEGLVTMEDVLEELVGEIWDEHDDVEEDVSSVGQNEWLIQGESNLGDLFETLNIKVDEESFEATSVGGWVMEQLDRMPKIGDRFVFEGFLFRVTKLDHFTVEELRAKKIETKEQ